jgi:ribosomal peptide maturation radical SAM protein 1
MLKVLLVSMPYTILTMPSIGIAQLCGVIRREMGQAVAVDPAYCYIDFAEAVGVDRYDAIGRYESKGLLDWMFRAAAFDAEDNLDEYRDYFFAEGAPPRKRKIFDLALEQRGTIAGFLDRLVERYHMGDYGVVGFTSMMSQNVASFALARRLKQMNPHVVTVMGGPNCEHPMGQTIVQNVPQIDYAFSGEALVSFTRFLKALRAGDRAAIASIKGVHTHHYALEEAAVGAGRSMPIRLAMTSASTPNAGELLESQSGDNFNLNDMPMLDYSEYLERIEVSPLRGKLKSELVIPFQTSTGCWWADKIPCSFCGLTPHPFREMTNEVARDYIERLVDKYRGLFSVFEATDPCMPVQYAQQVFPYVNQDKAVVLQYEVKASIPAEDMAPMAAANVILPQPGIESLSTKTLKIMRKGVTGFQNVQFLKRCVEHGLYPIWSYLYGFPNEDYDELDSPKLVDDIQTLCHLPPPSGVVPIAFQRYTEYFNDREKYGLKLRPAEHYFYNYPFDEAVLANLGYTFVDEGYARRFFTKHAAAIQALNLEMVSWMYKFRVEIPKLYFSGELEICDSRAGKPARFPIRDVERRALRYLDDPRSSDALARHLGQTREEAEELIAGFLKRRLVFVENGRYLNVVCERCALTADVYKNYYVNFVKNVSNAFD